MFKSLFHDSGTGGEENISRHRSGVARPAEDGAISVGKYRQYPATARMSWQMTFPPPDLF
jgi:hypothetical protein